MIDFEDVISRIKHIISSDIPKKKVLDKDVADTLGLTPQYFAVIKKRQKIPYEHIASFCRDHHISMNWILMAQGPAMWI
ncbi:MAG: hypothetical protein IE885_02945 [Campylobacterales bacterium]|nr:hypothetical protein [Campylobacterales bacterium]